MGRKKLEIKRIESKSSRQVTFTKRRNGLIQKAKHFSILCDVDVGLIIYSASGKLYDFSNSDNSLPEIIQKYHNNLANESKAIIETEQDHSTIGTFSTVKDLLDAVERHVEDPELNRTDFICLEAELEAALLETRARKIHLMMADVTKLEEKERKLLEENRLLNEKIAAMEGEKMDEGNGEFDCLRNPIPEILKLF